MIFQSKFLLQTCQLDKYSPHLLSILKAYYLCIIKIVMNSRCQAVARHSPFQRLSTLIVVTISKVIVSSKDTIFFKNISVTISTRFNDKMLGRPSKLLLNEKLGCNLVRKKTFFLSLNYMKIVFVSQLCRLHFCFLIVYDVTFFISQLFFKQLFSS